MADNPAQQAWRAILRIIYDGAGRGRWERACSELGLSSGPLRTLLMLSTKHEVTMRELADRWHCDPSYVTGLADELEAHGLAVRQPHPSDRRIKIVKITEAGLAARQHALSVIEEPPQSFGSLTALEQQQLWRLLEKVIFAEDLVPSGKVSGSVP